ncbi:hypothetical protein ACXWR7_11000, partial [Streptococcus pyogenes]
SDLSNKEAISLVFFWCSPPLPLLSPLFFFLFPFSFFPLLLPLSPFFSSFPLLLLPPLSLPFFSSPPFPPFFPPPLPSLSLSLLSFLP